jgi:hypothetical protein
MHAFLSKNIFYTFLLVFLPVLSLISWGNVSSHNFDLSLLNYLLTHILPTITISYAVAFLATDRLQECYPYTLPKVLLSFLLYVLTMVLFSYVFARFGYSSLFITLQLAGIGNAQEIGAKFYSFQLAGGLIMLVVYYSIATYAFGEKSFEHLVSTKPRPRKRASRRERVAKKAKVNRALA